MANEADRVVVELIAKVDGFDAKVKQSANSFDAGVKQIEGSASRAEQASGKLTMSAKEFAAAYKQAGGDLKKIGVEAERASGQMARFGESSRAATQRSRNLGYQISDIGTQLSMGTSPFIILAQQGPQVANALDGASGAVGRLATFLSGPLGAAVLFGTTMLGGFLLRTRETSESVDDLVQKLKENAERARDSERANDLFAQTLEGVRKAADDAEKAIEELRNAQKSQEQRTVESIQNALNYAAAIRAGTAALIAAAKAELARAEAQRTGPGGDKFSRLAGAMASEVVRARLQELEKELVSANEEAQRLEKSLTEALSFRAVEQGSRNAVEKINDRYDAMVEGARRAAVASGRTESALRKEVEAINAAREAELKRHRDSQRQQRNRDTADLTTFLRPVEDGRVTGRFGESRGSRTHAGIDIAVPVGTPVRAPAGGVVIESGVVGDYGNVIFIDHGRGVISRLAHLSKLNVPKGTVVEAGGIVGLSGGAPGAPGSGNSQGAHLHQEVRVGGRAVNPLIGRFNTDPASVEQNSRQLAEAAARIVSQQNAFEELRDRLNQSLLRAQSALVTGIEAQAALAAQQVEAEQHRLDAALQNDVQEGKLTQAHADQLKAINASITAEKLKMIEREKQLRLLQEESRDAEQATQFRVDVLRFQEQMARSEEERRRIGLDIIEVIYAEKLAHLERRKLIAEGNGDLREANRIQQQINNLPAQRSREEAMVRRGTMGPLETFLNQIPRDAEQANEALQDMAVRGIRSVADGLAQVGTEWIKVGGVAGRVINQLIADLIRLVLYQQLLAPLAGLLGGRASAGGGGGINVTGFGNPQFFGSAKGNVFSGGGIVPFASGGIVNAPTIFPMATGAGLMGEAGPEAIMPLGRDGQGRLGVRIANDRAASPWGGGQAMVIVGVQANDFFEGKILQVTGPVIAQASTRAAQGGAALARESLARKTLHRLG